MAILLVLVEPVCPLLYWANPYKICKSLESVTQQGKGQHLCLYTFVSKTVVYVSEISTVNLIIGWKLFAFRRKSTLSLVVFHIDMTSSMGLTSLAATWMNLCFWGSMYGFILSSFDRSGTTGFKCQLRSSYTLTIHITCMKMQLTIWMDFVENPRLHLN